jgi:cytochrome P450
MEVRVARPPGPHGLGVLRHLVLQGLPPTELFRSVAAEQPRLAHLRLGREHLYVATHPDTVREIFVSNGRSTMKGRALQRSKMLLGEGLLTSEGDLWRRQRRLVQPAFHADMLTTYVRQMVTGVRSRIDAVWTDGQTVELDREMAALTLSIVGEALFGTDLSDDVPEVADALTTMVTQFQRRILPGTELLDLLPTPGNRRGLQALQHLDAVVRRVVARRRDAGPQVGTTDVLGVLLAADMPDRQVRDEVMTLLLAGHETTANALTWSWFLLSRHPRQRAAMLGEVDAVLAERDPTAQDLATLPYTRAVLAEAMRLYPPAWSLGRRLVADMVVDGWTMPAGSLVVASQWVLHRDQRFWPDAHRFVPERWITADGAFDEGAPGQPRAAWFPFGLGQRVCVGESFAWLEGVLVLAAVARRWLVDVDATFEPDVQPAVTLRPRGHVHAVVRRREVQSPACQYAAPASTSAAAPTSPAS